MIADGAAVVEAFVAGGHVYGEFASPERLLELATDSSKFTRTDYEPGHFTASAVLVDRDSRRLLLIRHPKLGAWLQPGGHFEASDDSVAAAAAREGREETGLRLRVESAVPMALESHRIPPWGSEPSHLHLDLRFLFEVSGNDPIGGAELETKWFPFDSSESRGALGATLARVRELVD